MRRVLFAVLLLALVAGPAQASPFLVSDSYVTGVIPDHFLVSLDGSTEVVSAPWSGTLRDGTALTNAVHFDLGSVSVGAHSVTVRACGSDAVWGESCSALVPFSFTRPVLVAPNTPTGTQLKR